MFNKAIDTIAYKLRYAKYKIQMLSIVATTAILLTMSFYITHLLLK